MSNYTEIKKQFFEAISVLQNFMEDDKNLQSIINASQLMIDSLKSGGKIISCGNGGSFCDAQHFAEELSGRFRENRPGIAAISISDGSHITCVGNDFGFDFIFSRFIESVGNSSDLLLAISTSGNSLNVINAVLAAKQKGLKVVALTGKDGGKLKPMVDVCINVPYIGYADRVQEVHIKIIHLLIYLIEKGLTPTR
ncbi:MAG: D-sedoheptulose 7-phosphate isomerase [Bacteroidia bacterium]|nr:D-sedoheptulose 7-phosphate isomerase [Bacteroidia bacterium]